MRYIVLIYLLFIFSIPFFTAVFINKIVGLDEVSENHVEYFSKQKPFRANFTSPLDNLYSISLKLKNKELRNNDSVIFILDSDNKELKKIGFNGYNIGDSSWVRFSFEPILNSKDRNFDFQLISPNTIDQNTLGIHLSDKNAPAIITYHTIPSRTDLIKTLYTNLFFRITSDKMFLLLWGTGLIICLINLYFRIIEDFF